MKKIAYIIGIFFIFIGILMITMFNIFIFNFNKGIQNGEEITATISKIENDNVYVTYIVGNEEFTKKINFYSSTMHIGEKIKIVYEKDNPNKINVKIQDYFGEYGNYFKYIFYIAPISIIFIGVIILSTSIIRDNKRKKLLNNGLRIMGEIKSVEDNALINVNGRHPKRIIATYIYNGIEYESKSEDIWFDINDILNTYNIKEIPICIDPDNPKNYIMDINDIKSKLGN